MSLRSRAVRPSGLQQLQGCCAVQRAPERIGMAIRPDVIRREGGTVLAA